jgi:hypothetical protein
MRSIQRVGSLVIATALAAALLGGCGGDDPVKPPPPPPTGYPARTTPQHVLEALTMSYANRDSMEYKSLYDSSYVGTSTDLSDPPGTQVSTFRFSDEVAHIVALARTTTISAVFVDFGPSSSWTRLPSDDVTHPEWAQIQLSSIHLEIFDGQSAYEALSTNPMVFQFSPRLDSSSPTDTLWRIVRWNEVGGGL